MTAGADGPEAYAGAASLPRKLASIVAIDAAGYSRQSEIDEAAAVREITALGERIRASAGSRGGRIFSTAGDGFMLEFPSVAAALAAADEIQSVGRVPLRIGVHVGEVHETPKGDLLGKGVNVAARLMQAAERGVILVSGDAKRLCPADVLPRLRRRGTERLDKMNERVETYEFGSAWKTPLMRLPRRAPLAAGAAALVLALAAWFGATQLFQPRSARIAVLELEAPDAAQSAFAAALSDRIVGVMSVNDLQATPGAESAAYRGEEGRRAAARAGVAFILDGNVRSDGDTMRVDLSLVDLRANLALWSSQYSRSAAESEYMLDEVAAHAADVLHCALISLRPNAGDIDAQTLGLFLRACDASERSPEELRELARQITQRAPRFARGWSMLARASGLLVYGPQGEQMAQDAREAAARARRLDRNNGESYLVEAELLPYIGSWRERQALIDRALAAEPDLADAHAAQASMLMEVGRLDEALSHMRRAIAVEPLNEGYWLSMTPLLATAGHIEEVYQIRERGKRVWPNSIIGWFNRFYGGMFMEDPGESLAMLDAPEARERIVPDARAVYRNFMLARRSGDGAAVRRAANAFATVRGKVGREAVAAALVVAGDLDQAYRVLDAYLQRPGASTWVLFAPPLAPMRRDPRFMQLAHRAGLIVYWRETERWPDFCADPAWPYDCQQEAARLM